jgi:hypothetical protein
MLETHRFTALDPTAYMSEIQRIPLAPRVTDLNGKTVCFIEMLVDSGFEELMDKAGSYFKQRYPDITIKTLNRQSLSGMTNQASCESLVRKADAYVCFAAPTCSTTSEAVSWPAQNFEKQGVPGVSVIYDYLTDTAKATRLREGASIRCITVPVNYSETSDSFVLGVLKQIEEGLVKPLNLDESKTGAYMPERPPRVCAEGSLSDIQNYFYKQGMTDGLPIIPPTEEGVALMLKGTSHKPEEIVTTTMAPEKLIVTVEKVAINAVMAGALPEYMPVLLAAVEILGTNPSFSATAKSTNSFSFMQVVNGPIRKELDMNSGTYALGPGNRANAVIGRTLRLFLINLGGSRVGVNLMGVQGNVSGYSFAFAENEESSPWESLAEENGFRKDESTLSIFSGGWSFLGNYLSGSLDKLLEGASNFDSINGLTILFSPCKAKQLAAQGYTKAAIKEYIWKNTALPLGKFKKHYYYSHFVLPDIQGRGLSWPKSYLELPDDAIVPILPKSQVNVLVVGDPQGTPMMQGWHMSKPAIASIDKWK